MKVCSKSSQLVNNTSVLMFGVTFESPDVIEMQSSASFSSVLVSIKLRGKRGFILLSSCLTFVMTAKKGTSCAYAVILTTYSKNTSDGKNKRKDICYVKGKLELFVNGVRFTKSLGFFFTKSLFLLSSWMDYILPRNEKAQK